MKYVFIEEQGSRFGLEKMCRVLKVSRSGFYAWRCRVKSMRQVKNERLLADIREAHKRSRNVYGSPRITEELKENGIQCSRNRVARLMRINGIAAKAKRRFKTTTDSRHNLPVAKNLLNRQFRVDGPDKVWVSDITYIWTTKGWLYLAIVMDLFSRKIVGWAMSDRITQDIVISAFLQAMWRRKPKAGLMFHSDRGSQYAASDFRRLLSQHGVIQSMSGKGNCYDNAVAESFFHTLKTELIYHEKYLTREHARKSVFEYVELFYNRVRRHSTLGYCSPWKFEQEAKVA